MSRIITVVSLELHVKEPHHILVCYQLLLIKSTDIILYDGDVPTTTFSLNYVTRSPASSSLNCADSHGGPVSLHKPFSHFEIKALNALLEVSKDPCLDLADQEPSFQYDIVSQLPINVHLPYEDKASESQSSLRCCSKELKTLSSSQHTASVPQTSWTYNSSKGKELTEYCLLSNQAHGYVQIEKYPICIEISEDFKALVEHVRCGLKAGHSPQLASEGSGGVYFMKDACGMRSVAVFKPMDEEPMSVNNPRGHFCYSHAAGGEGLKKGTRSGEGAIREVAAYILDYPVAAAIAARCKGLQKDEEGFARVPPCAMVTSYHEAYTYKCGYKKPKLGSLQKFVDSFASCEEMGVSIFPVEEVHKITVLDMRLANTDRHAGNILVCRDFKDGCLKLVPIDHGYCLPEKFEECTFEWLYWPQASQPYGPTALKYIEALDAEQDIELLRQCGWTLGPKCARVLRIATMVLKKGAAAGLTPFQIGSIISCSKSTDKEPPIEALIEHAEELKCPNFKTELGFLQSFENLLDEHIARCMREGVGSSYN